MKVHFIDKTEDTSVMFVCNSLKFYNVNKNIKNVVQDIESDVPKNEILKKYNIKSDEYDNVYNVLSSETVEDITGERDDSLYRLVLNVTNKCNLDCKYCYAEGGNYLSSECMMDISTAKSAVDIFYKKYKKIQSIQFFGGEPLLNEPVIRFVCQYITELFETGKIESMPEFGTISNGTIYSDQLAQTIKKYKISVTFSIDGPQEVHNSMRVYKNGMGTFEKIYENISKYNMASVRLNGVEATYNLNHIKNNLSVFNTVKYFKDELNIPIVHIVPVSAEDGVDYKLKNTDSFSNSVKEIFEEMNKNKKDYSYSLVSRVVISLKKHKSNKYICEAGISNYSVSSKGDIYPCFMFTDVQNFKMGNVFDKTPFFENPTFLSIKEMLKKFNKYEYSQCKDCFNNRICSGCIGSNYVNNGDFRCTPDADCEMKKKLTENVLIELSNLV